MDQRSRDLRKLIVKGLEGAKKGHAGSAFSAVEIIRVLYDEIMDYKPSQPNWPDRDRFILSKGHGCLALYAILSDKGFIKESELSGYTSDTSRLGGCCEIIVPGVEATSGALGHGLPIGVGQALAAKLQKRKSRIFVLIGDGEMGEGSVWEAALAAAKHKLSNLTVLIDCNKLQIAGATKDILNLDPIKDKWEAFGFETIEIGGHDVEELKKILNKVPLSKDKPTALICHTVKGKGIPFAENDYTWHWKGGIDDELVAKMNAALEGK